MKTIFVGMAVYRDIYAKTIVNVFNALTTISNRLWAFGLVDGVNTPFARNDLVRQFLETDGEALVFIDQDMAFTPEQLDKLVSDLENNPEIGVVSGFYIKRDGTLSPLCGFLESGTTNLVPMEANIQKLLDHRGELIECDLVPTGFMAIRREVLESLDHPYFNIYIDEKGNHWSSDYNFCLKVKQTGFKVFCDLGLEIGHYGTFEWVPEHFYQRAPKILEQIQGRS